VGSTLAVLLAVAASLTAQLPQPGQFGSGALSAEEEEVTRITNEKNSEQRLALINDFLARFPESQFRGSVYYSAAEAYLLQGNHAKVVEYGERALEFAPKNSMAMVVVATSLAESSKTSDPDFQEKMAKAEDYAQRGLALIPENFSPMNMKRRPDVPEEEYVKAQRHAEALGHSTLGLVHLQRKQYAEAKPELEKALELKPSSWDSYRLGVANFVLRDFPAAEASYQRCLDLQRADLQSCQERCSGQTGADPASCNSNCEAAFGPRVRPGLNCQPQVEKMRNIIKAQQTLQQPQQPKP
jgi:tetratricopeptide (TPR) repeat protein